jgi:hypothetical protein
VTKRLYLCVLVFGAILTACDETQTIHVADYEAWKKLPEGGEGLVPGQLAIGCTRDVAT